MIQSLDNELAGMIRGIPVCEGSGHRRVPLVTAQVPKTGTPLTHLKDLQQ